MNTQSRTGHSTGHNLAVLGSSLLLADAVVMAITFVTILDYSWFHLHAFEYLLAHSSLPLALYLVWALTIFGTVASLVALTVYDFRTRWFWRCLVVNAVLWLIFSPIHAVLGIISLILLIRFRGAFSERRETA